MRTFTIVTALILLVGCQRATEQPTPAPVPAPMPQMPDQAAQNPPDVKKEEPKKDRFPLDQSKFKAAASGMSRDQVHAKFGSPDELGEWGAAVGWDGPVSIYKGPFSSADGKQAAKVRVYFRRAGASNVVANVEFVNQ